MASNDRDKHNIISWSLRKGSAARDIAANTGYGLLQGGTWNFGAARSVPIALGGAGILFSTILGTIIDNNFNLPPSEIQDSHISAMADSTDISYMAIDITEENDDPYVIAMQDGAIRLYTTHKAPTLTNEDELIWTFVDSQTQALRILELLESQLKNAKSNVGSSNFNSLPSFVEFEDVSGLFEYKDETSRLSSASSPIFSGAPYDLSDHIETQLDFVTSAIPLVESGQYGFSVQSEYTVVSDDTDSVINSNITPEGISVAAQYTMSPDLPDAPVAHFEDAFSKGFDITLKTIFGLTLITAGIGGLSHGTSSAAGHIANARRRKQYSQKP